MTNNIYAKYFIGIFNNEGFPLAVDKCSPLDILGVSGSQYPTCISETKIAWYIYSDLNCTSFVTLTIYNSSSQTGAGTLYDFNCDDQASRAYAEIEFSLFTCDTSNKFTVFTAVGNNVCAVSDGELFLSAYCEDDFAELYYFNTSVHDETYCNESTLFNTANITNECGFVVKAGGIKTYGQVLLYTSMFIYH